MAIEAVRMLMSASHDPDVVAIDVQVADEVATYLNNRKRREISRLEEENVVAVQILSREGFLPEQIEILGYDKSNQEIHFPSL